MYTVVTSDHILDTLRPSFYNDDQMHPEYCEVFTSSGRWEMRRIYIEDTTRDRYCKLDGEWYPHQHLSDSGRASKIWHI